MKRTPAPVWIENDDDYLDIRCDVWIDPSVDDGSNDLSLRFSLAKAPEDGSYLQLIDGGDSDTLPLNLAQVAAIGPKLAHAVRAFTAAGGMDPPPPPAYYAQECQGGTEIIHTLDPHAVALVFVPLLDAADPAKREGHRLLVADLLAAMNARAASAA